MSKTVVSSDNAPAAIGPYSPGIQTGNMVFLSGQLGIDPATGKLPEGVEAQAKQSLANVEALLTAAGATFADVVKTTVYLADIADFAAVNEIYASKFEAPFPARSAFQVAALPAGGLVENLLLVYPVTWVITATMFTIYHHSGNWLGRATA